LSQILESIIRLSTVESLVFLDFTTVRS